MQTPCHVTPGGDGFPRSFWLLGLALVAYVALITGQRDNNWGTDAWEHHRGVRALVALGPREGTHQHPAARGIHGHNFRNVIRIPAGQGLRQRRPALDVAPAPLTIRANDATKRFGAPLPARGRRGTQSCGLQMSA